MEWISSTEKTPKDKKPIRILIDSEEHIAYWYEDLYSYRVGIVNPCYFCGGLTPVSFDKNENREYYSPFYAEYWMPIPDMPRR